MTKRRFQKIYENTEDCFVGIYKGHTIEINRENDYQVYITVYGDQGYGYDGYWESPDMMPVAMNMAIEEAIKGAML